MITSYSQPEPTGWRGPNRDGIFPEKGLLTTWPVGGPQLLWKYEKLGGGYASAAVTNERVYTIGTIDSTSFVFCFSHQGDLLWKSALGPEWTRSFPGSRSTPTFFDGYGYYTNGNGTIYAFSASDGKILWQRDLMNECQGTNRNWGFADNLIVDGDRLYCTPVLIERGKSKLFINQPGRSYIALDAATGKLIWKYDKKEEHQSSHRTPIYRDGYLLGLDDETTGSVMLRIAPDGSGAEVAWRNQDLFSVQGEAVVVGDRIYGPGNRSKLMCVDWKTGKTLFSEVFGKGIFVLISAENLIYSYDVTGNFRLLKPFPDRVETVGSFQVPGGSNEHFSHPVIHDGRLYIRHENSLFVYNIASLDGNLSGK